MEDLANVWPQGGLFAFSGVDGDTCHAEPFVAAGLKDGIGWRFWVKPRLVFRAQVGAVPLTHRRTPTDFCLSDCWHCTVLANGIEGFVEGAFVDRASMVVSMAFEGLPEGVFPDLVADADGRALGGVVVYEREGCWLAVHRAPEAAARRFGIALSYGSEDDAKDRASRACGVDVAKAIAARMAFYESVEAPESLVGNNRRAYYKALSIQKVNIESPQLDIPCRWTTPDRMPHRHMWLWDTAFHVLGLQHTRTDLAQDALRALFAKQQDDGKLLLAAQPGKPPRVEDDSQPPIVTYAVCHHCDHSMQPDFLREMYPSLVRYIEWFEANRKDDTGLYGWQVRQTDDPVRAARGGESGMDNSPRFDQVKAITAADLSSYMASEYWCLEKLARCQDKYDEADEWRRRRLAIADRVNELLWDDEDRFYYDLDEYGEFVPVKTTSGFMPLLGQIPDRDRAESLRMHLMNPNEFWAPFPVPSVSQDEPSFSDDMWRGPTWVNVNLLIYYGLMAYGFFQEARQMARATLTEITRCYLQYGCFYEYYDAMAATPPADLPRKGAPGDKGGVGFGVVADLHWTAATFVHLAHELG